MQTKNLRQKNFLKILRARWRGMKYRCYNPKNNHYKNYGGRGIKMCLKWHNFDNFVYDMFESFEQHIVDFGIRNTTIERKNNNKGYNKGNCRWATRLEQAQNTRQCVYVDYEGKKILVSHLATRVNSDTDTVKRRLKAGVKADQNLYKKKFYLNGESVSIVTAARKIGMPKSTLINRVYMKGIPFEEAIKLPTHYQTEAEKNRIALNAEKNKQLKVEIENRAREMLIKKMCRIFKKKIKRETKKYNDVINFHGEATTLHNLSKKYKIDYDVLRVRVQQHGWPVELAVNAPVTKKRHFYYKDIKTTLPKLCEQFGQIHKKMDKRIFEWHWPIDKAFNFHPDAKCIELK